MQQVATAPMEYGIAVYLRNLSFQLDKIGRKCPDATTHEALVKICVDLADKAHVIETAFRVPKVQAQMSRYKGQLRASRTEQEFPHHVDIIVPPGGLGRRLDDMYNFHIQNHIKPQRGHGTHTADGSVIRWCFADADLAAAFASKFGA